MFKYLIPNYYLKENIPYEIVSIKLYAMNADSSDSDTYSAQFSPEGRIDQVEYASNAILNSGTALGMAGNDGVVLAVENITAPLSEAGGSCRTFAINKHIGAVIAGLEPDARRIISAARSEASDYAQKYDWPAPLSYIQNNVGAYVHESTLSTEVRPFGASIILGAYVPDGPQLYCVEPSGNVASYFGWAIGRGQDAARTKMESIDFRNTSITELVKEAAKIIYDVHDNDVNFELELSWSGKITDGMFVRVPRQIRKEAEDYAKNSTDNDSLNDSD